ncbi:MAG: tetratricopeptide repeat protein, partial [Zavarzinella sp.]|nr:tetratricopeptide repeat protein [Zavarzinella sp.]
AGTAYDKPLNLLLARCYEQLGEVDLRIEALGRVIADSNAADRYWVEGTLGLAEARATLEQTDAALELYQTVTARAPGAWLAIARLRLVQALQKKSGKPDLASVETAVQRAAEVVPADNTGLVILKSDLLRLKNDADGARSLLTKLRATKGDDVAVWVALATLDRADGGRAQAAATLDEAQQKLGDSVALRLARARLVIDPKAPDAAGQLRALMPRGENPFSKADRVRLVRGLADVAVAGGVVNLPDDFWKDAEVQAPDDLNVHMRRFDRALRADDFTGAGKVLEQIQSIDTPDGTTSRAARAFLLLRRAQLDGAAVADRDEAGRLLDALEVDRPGWSRVALGQAVVAELRKDYDKAIERYQKAVDQGEQDLAIIRHVVGLLYDQSRFAEAQVFLGRLPEAVRGTSDLSRLAADVSLRAQDPVGALRYANRAVSEESNDYRDLLWLAQVRWAAGGVAGMWETPARKAVAGAKGDPAPLIALVEMLVAAGRRADAEKVIAEQGDTVAPDRRAFAKGQCLMAVGKTAESRAAFQIAVREHPDEVRVVRAYANFLMQVGEFDPKTGAAAQWERLKALPGATPRDREQALLMIALCARLNQGAGGDYLKVREAVAAAGFAEGGVPKPPADDMPAEKLRSGAVLLSLQVERASKVQAIRYLERLEAVLGKAGQRPTAADRFLRGQLHAGLNEPDAARFQLAQAVGADPKNAAYLAFYVAYLIHLQRPDLLPEAETRFGQLKQMQPEEFRTAELGARLAAARKRPEEDVRKALAPWEAKPNAPVSQLAAIYESVGLYSDAARTYQAAAERSKRPEGLLPYAVFLGRRHRTEEALQQCEEARKQGCAPRPLMDAGVVILYAASNPSPGDLSRVLGWIEDALAKASGQPAVAGALQNLQAAVLNLQGRYDEVIGLYERLLTVNPNDAAAMNNLGYLLAAHKQKFDPAFVWLEKAKSLVGPLPELLDTEALVHLARANAGGPSPAGRKDLEAALALLGDVEAQAPKAITYFHLAQAWDAKARLHDAAHEEEAARDARDQARRAWQEARRRNLSVSELHPLERPDYSGFQSTFGT